MPISPVIITGMHRSGTSLLTRMLENFGLFVGERKQDNHEALFFLAVNNWLLSQANAAWDNVDNLHYIDACLETDMISAVKHILNGPDCKMFLGTDKFNCFSNLDELEVPWGWKDPRNILFIDIWKRIFPQARILNIYRNPVDVASSLKCRSDAFRKAVHETVEKGGISELLLQSPRLQLSARVSNIDEGIRLWENYNHRAIAAEDLYKDEMLSFRYEDLLESPENLLESICEFLGLNPNADLVQQEIKSLEGNRRYAFTRDRDLASINDTLRDKDIIKRLGYASIG